MFCIFQFCYTQFNGAVLRTAGRIFSSSSSKQRFTLVRCFTLFSLTAGCCRTHTHTQCLFPLICVMLLMMMMMICKFWGPHGCFDEDCSVLLLLLLKLLQLFLHSVNFPGSSICFLTMFSYVILLITSDFK